MSNLNGQVGELRFTVQVQRKDTGVVETHELIGAIDAAQLEQLTQQGVIHGSNALDSST